MIPSRPLDLGGIIGESIRIIRQTYWRTALLFTIFILPGFILTGYGLDNVVDGVEVFVGKFSSVSPETPTLIRDYLIQGATNTKSISLYRFQFPELFQTIDSVNSTITLKFPDPSLPPFSSRLDSIAGVVKNQTGKSAGDLLISNITSGLVLLSVGLLFLIFGSIAASAAMYDIASRAFEERAFPFGPIIKLSLMRSAWLLVAQYLLIFLAMITGLIFLLGIPSIISPVLGVFGFLAWVFLLIYAIMRILFSGIALVSEELMPLAAIKRSLALTSGIFGRVLGITIILGILIWIVSFSMQLILSIPISADLRWTIDFVRGNADVTHLFKGMRSDIHSLEIVYLLSSILTVGFAPVFFTTFYYDLRTRLDGPLEYPEESLGDITT